MPGVWYVCPYDVVTKPGGAVGRRCAVARYIPRTPNAAGAVWRELETLGNYSLVKVNAPLVVLAQLDGDPEFRRVAAAGIDTVALSQRPVVRAFLLARGFTGDEIDGTGWDLPRLLRLLASTASDVRERADRTGFEFTAGVRRARRPEDADDLNRLVND